MTQRGISLPAAGAATNVARAVGEVGPFEPAPGEAKVGNALAAPRMLACTPDRGDSVPRLAAARGHGHQTARPISRELFVNVVENRSRLQVVARAPYGSLDEVVIAVALPLVLPLLAFAFEISNRLIDVGRR